MDLKRVSVMAMVRNAWAAQQNGCQPGTRNINENFTDVKL